MCGIAGVYFKKKDHGYSKWTINKFMDGLLRGIEPRGRHATGFVAIGWGGTPITQDKGAEEARTWIKGRQQVPEDIRAVLLHTRWATQGDPSNNDNNHPVRYKGVYVVHNGVITNDDEIFKSMPRIAEVDSMAIPAVLHKHGFDKADKALEKLKGGFAIAAIYPNKARDTVILAKGGGYPLVVHENETFIVWASSKSAIESAWKGCFQYEGEAKLPDWFEESTKELYTGDLWRIRAGKIVKERFKPAAYTTQRSTSTTRQTTQTQSYEGPRHNYGRDSAWGNRGAYAHSGIFREAKTALVAAGMAQAVPLPPWDERPPEMRFMHQGKYCITCRETVKSAEMKYSQQIKDTVCLDCFDLAEAKAEDLLYMVPDVEKDVMETLELYAALEEDVHQEVVKKIGEKSGLAYELVDYLIFRIPDKYVQRDPDVRRLQQRLRDMYDKVEEREWKEVLWGEVAVEHFVPVETHQERSRAKAAREAREARKHAPNGSENGTRDDKARIWMNCPDHGMQPYPSVEVALGGCPECAKKESGLSVGADGRVELPCASKDCGGIKSRAVIHMKWWICNTHYAENVEYYKMKPVWDKLHPTLVEKAVNLRTFANKNDSDCYFGTCDQPAVATLLNGRRSCHVHARGKKGTLFDGTKHRSRGNRAGARRK